MADEQELTQDIDSELQSLLNDLKQVSESVEEEVSPPTDNAIQIQEPSLSEPVVEEEQQILPNIPIESELVDLTDFKEIVKRFNNDYDEVQVNLKLDRSKIDSVITILLTRVRDGSASEADTISLVKALNVLTDTNGHSVKLLDSRSKLLSATKSSINAIQTNVSVIGTDAELQNILKQPLDEDE